MAKSEQLQIRVTAAQKAALRRLARTAGLDVSTYVLTRALPSETIRFADLLAQLRDPAQRRFVLAALDDFLMELMPAQFGDALARADLGPLDAWTRNYVAAMVEYVAHARGVHPPAWAAAVTPLDAPWFATDLPRLRRYLLRASPVVFRRRNLFIDAPPGSRV